MYGIVYSLNKRVWVFNTQGVKQHHRWVWVFNMQGVEQQVYLLQVLIIISFVWCIVDLLKFTFVAYNRNVKKLEAL